MIFYGNKAIRKAVNNQIYAKKETIDAIVWSINKTTRKAIVRIQGSSVDIYANWPNTMLEIPNWLREGAGVRIVHTKGNRNRIELDGPSRLVPTPVGGGSVLPVIGSGENAIISGLIVSAHSGMALKITSGVYRINGVNYQSVELLMGDTSFDHMGEFPDVLMGSGDMIVKIPTAPTGSNFRIDVISINTSGVITITSGTPSTTPTEPNTPTGQVKLASVIVPPSCTDIIQSYIGNAWSSPTLSGIEVTYSLQEMLYTQMTNTITLSVVDQYGVPFYGTHQFTIEIVGGNGVLSNGDGGSGSTTSITKTFTGTSSTVTYTRYEDPPTTDPIAGSPTINVYMTSRSNLYNTAFILLYDVSGDFLPPY